MERGICLCEENRFCDVSNMQCSISLMKRSNIKRYFDSCQTMFASKYPEEDSKKARLELLCKVKANQQQFHAWTQQGDPNLASFAASLAIVKNEKPFIDGEYAKIFMLDVANQLFEDFSNIEK